MKVLHQGFYYESSKLHACTGIICGDRSDARVRETQREVAERLGFRDRYVVKRLMKREKAKRAKLETGIPIGPEGRPRKDSASGDIVAQQAYEIQRLRLRMKKSQLLVNLQEETEDSV